MKPRFLAIIMAVLMLLTCVVSVSADTVQSVTVEPISIKNPDFIRGMDVSSVIALEQAGVVFRDENGVERDIFRILADNGVNYIRVRVWNDPYDSDGNGYGGGNNDVIKAAEIGRRAAACGMKLLVDFHYSDFWADPSKQQAPKAWNNLTLNEKISAVSDFTYDSLSAISAAGADIGMAQIGNETNNGIAGEYDFDSMAKIYNAGAAAVRRFSDDVKVAVHLTNPEWADGLKAIADKLHSYNVDYDVFAVSYYPYWHGSLSNLNSVLSYVSSSYGKYSMVAETSYAYTLDDSDGHPNTVSSFSNCTGENLLWPFTPQGQADEVRAVMAAVNEVPDGLGLGVFYWEGAWLTVGDITGMSWSKASRQIEENKLLWEKYGAGWASSYSVDYDPDDAGQWHGGSAVDNQAFFAPDGTALPSLKVFREVMPRILGDADLDRDITMNDVTLIQRAIVDMVTLNDTQKFCADVNENSESDIMDVTFIQRYLADMVIKFKVGEPI